MTESSSGRAGGDRIRQSRFVGKLIELGLFDLGEVGRLLAEAEAAGAATLGSYLADQGFLDNFQLEIVRAFAREEIGLAEALYRLNIHADSLPNDPEGSTARGVRLTDSLPPDPNLEDSPMGTLPERSSAKDSRLDGQHVSTRILLGKKGSTGTDAKSKRSHIAPPSEETAARLRRERAEDLLGRHLGKYVLQTLAGTGAMGWVYVASNRHLDSTVAIKVLRPKVALGAPELIDRFRVEARVTQDLLHPNIVRVYDFDYLDDHYFIALEYVAGKTLEAILQSQGSLAESRALSLALDVCSALEHAHESGVVHRDIKPSNIMVTFQGQPKLTDFGLAKCPALQSIAADTGEAAVLGTLTYCAPEQQTHANHADLRCDMYALGATLFEMCTGRAPFVARTAAELTYLHQHAPPPDPRTIKPQLTGKTASTILRLLEKQPNNRYECYRDLRNDLLVALYELEHRVVDSME